MTTAAIYTRISKDKPRNGDDHDGDEPGRGGDGLGVKRQLDECRALADRLGWDVVRSFEDNDLGASTEDPAGL